MEQITDMKRADQRGPLAIGFEVFEHATEKTVRAVFAAARDVNSEMRKHTLGLLDWIEGMQRGTVGLARSVVQRGDEVAVGWIDAEEQVVLGTLHALMAAGQSATQLAPKAAPSAIGARPDGAPMAQA
jgi:hypothetical protein